MTIIDITTCLTIPSLPALRRVLLLPEAPGPVLQLPAGAAPAPPLHQSHPAEQSETDPGPDLRGPGGGHDEEPGWAAQSRDSGAAGSLSGQPPASPLLLRPVQPEEGRHPQHLRLQPHTATTGPARTADCQQQTEKTEILQPRAGRPG